MRMIGLTGGSAAGKTTLGGVARDMGFYVIDADKVGHGVIKRGSAAYDEIVAAYGEGILLPDGEINRRALGGIVFSDPQKLALLNSITHKRIEAAVDGIVKTCGSEVVVLDAAALFESGMDQKCDYIIAVISPREDRITRICIRDGICADRALGRINSQKSDDFYVLRANKIINNDGDLERLKSLGRLAFEEALNEKKT